MKNRRKFSAGLILNIVLLILNLAMIAWIILSWRGEQKQQSALNNYRSISYDAVMSETAENGSLHVG